MYKGEAGLFVHFLLDVSARLEEELAEREDEEEDLEEGGE